MNEMTQEQKTWGMIAHLSSLSGLIIPLGNVIGPLVVWLIKKDTMPFVADQAKEALNFSITLSIIGAALLAITVMSLFLAAILTIPLLAVVGIVAIILIIIAAVKANDGVAYRYPLTLRLVK